MAEQESPTTSSVEGKPASSADPTIQVDTSYEDAMQARIMQLGNRAKSQRKRNMIWSAAAFVILVVLTVAALLLMQSLGGGGAFEEVFKLK